ncbi:MAG TPA: hypothetical protein VFM37_15290 [Pseudonocardiaceae bacterium]|nr:hypothetical protein [Pseudonocardiaceae bacterium]
MDEVWDDVVVAGLDVVTCGAVKVAGFPQETVARPSAATPTMH